MGPRTAEVLESLGVLTIGHLAELPRRTLFQVFGEMGYALHRAARGVSTSPVTPDSVPKSIGRETTFERDLLDWDRIERILTYLAERAAYALRESRMETRCVTLKVRIRISRTHTFAQTLPDPTSVDSEVLGVLKHLIPKAKQRRARVRLIGVSFSSLIYNQHQLYLFGTART